METRVIKPSLIFIRSEKMRFLILSFLVLGCSAGLPSFLSDLPVTAGKQTVKTSIGKVSTNGFEGLNLVWSAPFKIDQYVVGFKVALTSLTKKGAKLPDSLFVKRTISTPSPLDGSATVDADFCVESKVFSAEGNWRSSNHDLEVTASGNTDDLLSNLGFNTKAKIGDAKAAIKANYNLLKKKLAGELKVDYSDTSAQLFYDTENEDPVIKLTQVIDKDITVSPSVSLKTLKQVYHSIDYYLDCLTDNHYL